jgi:hypothetical protein
MPQKIFFVIYCTLTYLELQVEITETARQLVLAVQRLCQRSNFSQRNFTVNHLVEIWRGAKTQKVRFFKTNVSIV